MFIYFKFNNSVLTCEYYPKLLPVDEMKKYKLEYMCNKWIKNDTIDGNFTLSYNYKKWDCDCDNTEYIQLEDYHDYQCYNCGIHLLNNSKPELYLQNGGIDVLIVGSNNNSCKLCEVDNYPNIYKWADCNTEIYALHINNGNISDCNITNQIDSIKDLCYITFTEFI